MDILKNIDIQLVKEETVDLSNIKETLKTRLENSGLLQTKSTKYTSDATFESDIWILKQDLNQVYCNLDMEFLNDMKRFNHMSNESIIVFKCWLSRKILDGESTGKLRNALTSVESIIKLTNNFNLNDIENNTGNSIATFLASYKGKTKKDKADEILDYIYYLDELDIAEDGHYKALESILTQSYDREDKARKLPSENEMLLFDFYLKYFYEEDKKFDENIKMFYMPLLIWWKLTTIIPIRPSELCSEMKRDCLIKEDEKYYILINRVKVNNSNKGVVRKSRIPLLNKIEVTKEIYDLIDLYIRKTNGYGKSDTLFSYRALCAFRKNIAINNANEYGYITMPEVQKNDEDNFSVNVLGPLLDNFHKQILSKSYGLNINDNIDLGDTRHLAFTSLLLQGVSPIEIAMLGGHTSLSSQDHYQGHTRLYVDSEIMTFIRNKKIVQEKGSKSLKERIFNMEEECKRDTEDCMPTEDGAGYCTIDLTSEDITCNGENCLECNHWWCPPTNESFITVVKYLKENVIRPIDLAIKKESMFLEALLDNVKTKNVNGLLELDRDYENELQTVIKRLNRNILLNAETKKSLIDYNDFNKYLNIMAGGGDRWLEQKEK